MTTAETLMVPETVAEARTGFRTWLAENRAPLEQFRETGGELTEIFDRLRRLQRMLYDAGWIRLGWPESAGGLGGRRIRRSIISEELAHAGYPPPVSYATQEVLGPAVAEFAPAELAGVVGPLIEVPVLVALVYVSLALRKRFTDQTVSTTT